MNASIQPEHPLPGASQPSPAGAGPSAPPAPFLVGDRVTLRPLEREDLAQMQVWVNDPEIRALIGEVMPTSRAGAEQFFERVQQDRERVWFVVTLRDDGRIIGEAGLLRIFHPWRSADLSLILGDKTAWSSGYGTEAIRLLLDYAFGALSLHRVALGVVSFNERALRFYEKAGFRREGVQRDGYFHDHRYHDFVMMSILEDEYRVLHGRR